VSRWVEAGRGIGFFLLLLAGTGLLGFCISWPLWMFSTREPGAYTLTVLSLAGACIVFLIARAFLRKHRAVEDLSKPRVTLVTALLTLLMVLVGITGAFAAIALLARRMWIWGMLDILVWVGILWLLGRARGFAKTRKAVSIPAENLR
jgi:hypothetical protein